MHDIRAEASALQALELSQSNAETEPFMRVLGDFNQCMVGLVRFRGQTQWERHRDDELLHVLAGEVEITVATEAGEKTQTLRAGEICIVPRDAWHRQRAADVTLLFVTSRDGNEHKM